ncbi:MAG: D-erythronate dehydrogenase [Vicinamibacterales bacterium]
MHVVITGGAGFLGRRLAEKLLQRGTLRRPDGTDGAIDQLTLVDVASSVAFPDPRVRQVTGDIADSTLLEGVVDPDTTSIFHLAAVVSGMAESDFDIGMHVNLDATRALLEVCRAAGHRPRLVFTSSVAVYGGRLPDPVPDSALLNPQTSYGTQKAIAELLINDYTRRGFVDGRSLRLPTISVRPGKPNAAASSFASGIIREPLNGIEAICPVGPETRLWLLSPRTVIDCLVTAHEIAGETLGTDRALNLPGISVTVGEMAAALERVAGPAVVGRIRWERDARLERMVLGWPGRLEATRARALGFPADDNFDATIRQYIEEARPAASSVQS